MTKQFTGSIKAAVAAAGLALALARTACGQGERSNRIEIHPVTQQIGIVSKVVGKTAWIGLPQRVQEGAKVSFTAYSDGGDVLATGKVAWASTVAPYEAYITGVHAVTTRHDINEFDDLFTIGSLTHKQVEYGAEPRSNGNGVELCVGFFARVSLKKSGEPEGEDLSADTIEPVRANIAALRSQKNKTATAIADAATKALGLDPLTAEEEQSPDYAVNFSALADNLRTFRRLTIPDPITDKLLRRLLTLADHSGSVGASVPNNFIRPQGRPTTGGGGVTGVGTTP